MRLSKDQAIKREYSKLYHDNRLTWPHLTKCEYVAEKLNVNIEYVIDVVEKSGIAW